MQWMPFRRISDFIGDCSLGENTDLPEKWWRISLNLKNAPSERLSEDHGYELTDSGYIYCTIRYCRIRLPLLSDN